MKEWKCKDCEVFETHLCHFTNMKAEYKACEYVVVDHNEAYEQGRIDAIEEFVTEYEKWTKLKRPQRRYYWTDVLCQLKRIAEKLKERK